MRLQPPIVVIPKHSASDVVIPTEGSAGEGERLYIPRGTDVYLDIVALHRNRECLALTSPAFFLVTNPSLLLLIAKYWGEDCDTYKPERFMDAIDGTYRWPREAFMGFSAGPRSCLGQRFSSGKNSARLHQMSADFRPFGGAVSATAVLALLFRKYRVYLSEDYPQRSQDGEPFKAKVERIMHARYWMSLTPDPVSVVFVER